MWLFIDKLDEHVPFLSVHTCWNSLFLHIQWSSLRYALKLNPYPHENADIYKHTLENISCIKKTDIRKQNYKEVD